MVAMLHRVVGPRGYFVTGTLRLTSAIKPTPAWRCLKRSVGTESTSTALSARFGSGELKDFIKDTDKARAAPPDPAEAAPYLDVNALRGDGRHVYFETYGCQVLVSLIFLVADQHSEQFTAPHLADECSRYRNCVGSA